MMMERAISVIVAGVVCLSNPNLTRATSHRLPPWAHRDLIAGSAAVYHDGNNIYFKSWSQTRYCGVAPAARGHRTRRRQRAGQNLNQASLQHHRSTRLISQHATRL